MPPRNDDERAIWVSYRRPAAEEADRDAREIPIVYTGSEKGGKPDGLI